LHKNQEKRAFFERVLVFGVWKRKRSGKLGGWEAGRLESWEARKLEGWEAGRPGS